VTPREFLDNVVRPNVTDFHAKYDSIRIAHNAVGSIDALVAHIFTWCSIHVPDEIAGIRDDSEYRGKLAARNREFDLLRDIAKAQKHVHLTRGNPQLTNTAQINTRPIGFGEGRFGEGRFGGPPQVVVDLNAGGFEYVERIVDSALAFLESEMNRLGI
jgi:hypothetical protein